MAVADRVGRLYRNALRDLTFNSKPIINNLTMLAQEHAKEATSIVQVLLNHLQTANPGLKLPTLYLIDSICKNIGEPFVGLFANEIMPVFTRSISDLHDRKLEYEFVRVLRTWKGLFPEPIVRELERRHGMLAGPNYSQNSGTAAAPQASTKRPRNSSLGSGTDIDVGILKDLDLKARNPEKRPLIEALNILISDHPASRPEPPQVNPPFLPFLDPQALAALSPALSLITSTTTTSSNTSSSSTSAVIQPTNEDIHRERPDLYWRLYQDLPLQCKTCGFRFQDTPEGKEKMDSHLDAHFRRNMRLKDLNKRIMTRDWFCSESDWISGTESVSLEKQVSVFDKKVSEESSETGHVTIENLPVGSDHTPRTCSICQEPIELFWDDDVEEWMLRNAVLVVGQLMHGNCKNKSE